MTSTHPIHLPEPIYLPPDVHVPRDVTDDDFDDTSVMGDVRGDAQPEDWIWTDQQFEKLVMESSGIWPSIQIPYVEPVSVLLPSPKNLNSVEMRELFEQVMSSLRKRVAELEEEELFESAMRKFTHRSTMTANIVDPSMNILMAAGGGGNGGDGNGGSNGGHGVLENGIGDVMAEPEGPGLGEQPRSVDVAELLRADIRAVRQREKVRDIQERLKGAGAGGTSKS